MISALVVLLVLLFFAPFFYDLQKCVLACIIIVSLRGALRKFKDVPTKWRTSRNDAIVWLVTMSATALISVELGLLVGIVFSMACVIFKMQSPKVSRGPDADSFITHGFLFKIYRERQKLVLISSPISDARSRSWVV